MADEDDKIIIEVDLDSNKFKKSSKDLEKDSEQTGQNIGQSLDKNITETLNKNVTVAIQNVGKTMDKASSGIIENAGRVAFNFNQIADSASKIGAVATLLVPVARNFKEINDLAMSLSSVLFKGRGLFGFTTSLLSVAAALGLVAEGLSSTNNEFAKAIAFAARFSAVLLGGLAAGITFAVIKFGELANIVGGKLVGFFDQAAKNFNKTEQSLDVFRATVDAVNRNIEGTIGTFEVWEAIVGQVANTFNFARDEVRKSAQEILLVGSKIGLAEQQMRQLVKITAEYARINKKDVFPTTVAFVNALNGNAQSVAALGVKLNQTALQQQAYKEGITRSVASLNDAQKVQLRFNKILSQYGEVAGIGVLSANTLAGAQERLEINQKRLTTALGEGARAIEQNNILAFAFDKILNNLSSEVTRAAGLFGAIGARVLQVGGFFLEIGFQVFAVIKAFKLLKVLLSSDLGVKAFASSIPLLNKSLNQLLSSLTGTQVEIKSLGSLIKSLRGVAVSQFSSFTKVIIGQSAAGVGAIEFLRLAFVRLRAAVISTTVVLAPYLLVAAKFALVIGAIVGTVTLVVKAFQELENRTGALSTLWDALNDALGGTPQIFKDISTFASDITESIKTLAFQGFGLLIAAITEVISLVTSIAKRNPFGVFSKSSINSLNALDERLSKFSSKLVAVNFDTRKLGEDGSRAIAGFANNTKINLEDIAKTIDKLRERYANFGQSTVQILQNQQTAELEALQIGFQNKLIAEQEFLTLKEQLNKDFGEKIKLAREEETLASKASFQTVADSFVIQSKRMVQTAGQLATSIRNVLGRGFGSAFQKVGQAFASGTNALQAFGDAIKGTFADLASALGDYYIAKGIALTAAKEPGGPATIAAGAGLKVLSGLLGGGGGGVSAGTAGAGGGVAAGDGGVQNVDTGRITNAEAERPEADTQLSLNINGDYFDNGAESGERMVDLLGDAFGKKGVVLRDLRTA